MKEAVNYAVNRLKQDGYAVDEVVSRRLVGYMFDYIADELKNMRPVQITGLGTFKHEVKKSRTFYSAMLKKECITKPTNTVKFKPSSRFLGKVSDENK